jgi:hypothetical protein
VGAAGVSSASQLSASVSIPTAPSRYTCDPGPAAVALIRVVTIDVPNPRSR